VERQIGSHRRLHHPERGEYKIGPIMVGKVAKKTGLTPADL
jgi:predicted RNA binding protein YcfA (HicA-like mRNA interferase family)